MYDLADEDVTLLRGIADDMREQSSSVLYGRFHGGDPNDFYPDHECCTPEEIEAHAQAVASYVERGLWNWYVRCTRSDSA